MHMLLVGLRRKDKVMVQSTGQRSVPLSDEDKCEGLLLYVMI